MASLVPGFSEVSHFVDCFCEGLPKAGCSYGARTWFGTLTWRPESHYLVTAEARLLM